MENKITEEELEQAKKQQEDLQKVILDIGVIETKKHAMLHKIADINTDIEELKKVLEEKYGHVNINLEDGTYTEVENEEDKKD
mgnify:FL=1|jgi:hypothetical protein|tara:strand:+ start:324 stop:572 length:249 start_codon:yes stop_codon:yes gene_type:complete